MQFVLLALFIFACQRTEKQQAQKEPTQQKPFKQVTGQVLQSYFADHSMYPDHFWLTGKEEPNEWLERVEKWRVHTEHLLANYTKVDPLVPKILTTFQHIRPSQYMNGASMFIGATSEHPTEAPDGIEVCLGVEYNHPKSVTYMMYREDWQALMTLAIDMPDVVTAALILHGLSRAYTHQVEQKSCTLGSDEHIAQEAEFYRLEMDILNYGTGGKLYQLYDTIRGRATTQKYIDVYSMVTRSDLTAFDKLLGTSESGPIMADLYATIFYYGLGLRNANLASKNEDERRTETVAFVRWIEGQNKK